MSDQERAIAWHKNEYGCPPSETDLALMLKALDIYRRHPEVVERILGEEEVA